MDYLFNFIEVGIAGGLVIIAFILQIILFFKIWGMTNDVREIKHKYLSEENKPPQRVPPNPAIGDIVIEEKTGREIMISEINPDGTYKCYTKGGICIGDLKKEELRY